MSDETLLACLRMFAGMKGEFDKRTFASEISKLIGVDHSLRVEEIFTKVQSNLSEYLYDHNVKRRSCLGGHGPLA